MEKGAHGSSWNPLWNHGMPGDGRVAAPCHAMREPQSAAQSTKAGIRQNPKLRAIINAFRDLAGGAAGELAGVGCVLRPQLRAI